MDYQYWFVCAEHQDGVDSFCPIEFKEDGSFNVVTGLTMCTTLTDIIQRGAKKIWRVDDMYEAHNTRLEYERAA